MSLLTTAGLVLGMIVSVADGGAAAGPGAGGHAFAERDASQGAASEREAAPPAKARSGEARSTDSVALYLRHRIEAAGTPPRLTVGAERIHSRVVLPRFYVERVYEPAWTDDDGPLPVADALLRTLRLAERDGLRAADYHLAAIEAALEAARRRPGDGERPNPRALVDLELLLTDAFLMFGAHLLDGRLNRETLDPEWHASRSDRDLAAVLEEAVSTGRIPETLHALRPQQPAYMRLRAMLLHLRGVAANGGWPAVPEGPTLRAGERDPRVVPLRQRLVAARDLAEADAAVSDPERFDEAVDIAVRRFQRRHGLSADGAVGAGTLRQLNVPVEDRIRQVEVNLERWRWLPAELGERYILVNIAGFTMQVVEDERAVLEMPVVVGRPYRRTPVFSDRMTYLVFNPFWHVPPGIAANDVLPQVRRDVGYLARQNMRVFQGWGESAREVDPTTVDWAGTSPGTYRFRQDPGPNNALGRVKFMFPNRFNVYLHDTPARELFGQDARAFSSGCIRVQDALGLAAYLLADDPRWSRDAIAAEMRTGRSERTVRLPRPIGVHLLYWTAWAAEDGTINFRPDVYERDGRVDRALREPPPPAPLGA